MSHDLRQYMAVSQCCIPCSLYAMSQTCAVCSFIYKITLLQPFICVSCKCPFNPILTISHMYCCSYQSLKLSHILPWVMVIASIPACVSYIARLSPWHSLSEHQRQFPVHTFPSLKDRFLELQTVTSCQALWTDFVVEDWTVTRIRLRVMCDQLKSLFEQLCPLWLRGCWGLLELLEIVTQLLVAQCFHMCTAGLATVLPPVSIQFNSSYCYIRLFRYYFIFVQIGCWRPCWILCPSMVTNQLVCLHLINTFIVI